MTFDIVEYHDGLVDQDPHRQRQPAQRHGVDRVAGEIETDQGREDRNGDRDDDHQGRTEIAEEDQHDQSGEHGSQHTGNPQRVDTLPDLHRLVHDHVQFERGHLGSHHRIVPLFVL